MSPFVCRGLKIILKGSCCLPCSIILTHSPRAILSLRSSNSLIEACIVAPSITGGNSKASEIDIENAKNIWKGRELRMKFQDICYVLDMGSPAPSKRTGIFLCLSFGFGVISSNDQKLLLAKLFLVVLRGPQEMLRIRSQTWLGCVQGKLPTCCTTIQSPNELF